VDAPRRPVLVCLSCLLVVLSSSGTGEGRPFQGRGNSPPQPRQDQGLAYFLGTWTFSWHSRESPISSGPRTGAISFTQGAADQALAIEVNGTVDDTGVKYRETGTAEWDPQTKKLSIREKLAAGVELSGTGDWSSALSIRYESQPTTIAGSSIRVRRVFSILSATSFTVTEEFSVDGGEFQRLGQGAFKKTNQ
jgi:hypothetical protein